MLPWVLPGSFYVAIASHVLVAAVLALSLNILVGYCGMSSLGHAVYLGVPAYTYAALVGQGSGVPLSARRARWRRAPCWRPGSACWRCGPRG